MLSLSPTARCYAATAMAVVAWAIPCLSAPAAPFTDLDFEQASVVPTSFPPYVEAGPAFPGWTALINDHPISTVLYDSVGAGEVDVALWDMGSPGHLGQLLQGRFMAALIRDGSHPYTASLTQSGDIPPGSQSIRLLGDGGRGPVLIFINGAQVPLVRLDGVPISGFIDTYGGDVSSFAGQTVQLALRSLQDTPQSAWAVDDISFSGMPIPEASATPLAVVIAFCLRYRRRPTMEVASWMD